MLPMRSGTGMAERIPFVAAILVMLGCGLALTLLLTTRAAEDSYLLSDAREVNQALADERAALRREVAVADSAPELAARARELGMIPATDPARLVVAPDGTVTVIGEPEPAHGQPVPPLNPSPTPPAPRSQSPHGERIVPVTTSRQPEPGRDDERVSAAPPAEAQQDSDQAAPGDTPTPSGEAAHSGAPAGSDPQQAVPNPVPPPAQPEGTAPQAPANVIPPAAEGAGEQAPHPTPAGPGQGQPGGGEPVQARPAPAADIAAGPLPAAGEGSR